MGSRLKASTAECPYVVTVFSNQYRRITDQRDRDLVVPGCQAEWMSATWGPD
jgi:hypothetical protein